MYRVLKFTSIGLLFLITGYHLLSNKWANRINQTITMIKMTILVVIAFSGISRYNNADNWNTPLSKDSSGGSVSSDFSSYSVAITQILFSYDGWNSLNYSLDEFRNP